MLVVGCWLLVVGWGEDRRREGDSLAKGAKGAKAFGMVVGVE